MFFFLKTYPLKVSQRKLSFLGEVRDSDIYIGIIGQQYGSVDQSKISSTEQEYREAKRLNKTILVYIKR